MVDGGLVAMEASFEKFHWAETVRLGQHSWKELLRQESERLLGVAEEKWEQFLSIKKKAEYKLLENKNCNYYPPPPAA